VSPIVLLVLVMTGGALLEALVKRRWLSVLLPTAAAAAWLAWKAGLLHSPTPDSTARAVFVSFLPVTLALYAGAATFGSVAASFVKGRWCSRGARE
jgi:hypothetical protein